MGIGDFPWNNHGGGMRCGFCKGDILKSDNFCRTCGEPNRLHLELSREWIRRRHDQATAKAYDSGERRERGDR